MVRKRVLVGAGMSRYRIRNRFSKKGREKSRDRPHAARETVLTTAWGAAVGAAVTVLVGVAVTAAVGFFHNHVANGGAAVTWHVETDPSRIGGFAGQGIDMVFPADSPPETIPPPGCSGFGEWAVGQGGIDRGTSSFQIVVQAKASGQVAISHARAVVESTRDLGQDIAVSCPPAGPTQFRELFIDLDSVDPVARYQEGVNRSPFGFTLDPGDEESFLLSASTASGVRAWILELVVISDGESQTIVIDDDGEPFQTAENDGGISWEWNYQDAWHSSGDYGTAIPAGGRLYPLT